MFTSNAASFARSLKDISPRYQKRVAERIVNIARFVHKGLIDRTPVWEGQTVRNYIMTIDSGFSSKLEAIGSEPTGQTSKMGLGSEPRRLENEAAALDSGSVLSVQNAFSKIYITNNSDNVSGLELGQLPDAGRSRSPNGMFAITLEEAISKLNSQTI